MRQMESDASASVLLKHIQMKLNQSKNHKQEQGNFSIKDTKLIRHELDRN